MNADESAFKKFQDEPYFEVLTESIARNAAEYAYAILIQKTNPGSGNHVDYHKRAGSKNNQEA